MEWNRVFVSDALEGVKRLPDNSVQSVVTSPPYFQQRDYGIPGQWGLESSPEEYVDHLVKLFQEVRRVLKDSGTAWIVLGDSYAKTNIKKRKGNDDDRSGTDFVSGIKRKDLLGIPWTVALSLRRDGWWLRQDILWFKNNSMPESVTDRCSRCHEYIFMFTKNANYYYDHLAIATPLTNSSDQRMNQEITKQKGTARATGKKNGPMKTVSGSQKQKQEGHGKRYEGFNERGKRAFGSGMARAANRKSVWTIATSKSKEDHYASYPASIPELCIKASTRENDVVMDPFAGTGTTLLQASILGRRYWGCDLNPKYVGIARRRLKEMEGLFYRE